MKWLFFLPVILSITCVNGQALYRCQQDDGKFLFSDKPCVERHTYDNSLINTYGVASELAISEKPIVLSADLVDQLFIRIEHACQAKDGRGLFDLFSAPAKETILEQKLQSQDLFNHLEYLCHKMVDIRADFKKYDEPILYATKKPQRDILLCFYTQKEGIKHCTGNIKVTAENKQLKLIEM